ncbi:unnamed protein product [Danaus chrysippus]|uniref:(African queen) hypothetical protein n=1 Tax=Danaus chrysippus TaxID=151541 RepID=A0A8J2QSA3_9NEOP|nr:unnamed protein product [Danaus chrysippus]
MKQVKDPYNKGIDDFLKIDQVLNELSYNGSYLTKETTFENIQIDCIFENISSLVFSHNFGSQNETRRDTIDNNGSINESQEILDSNENNIDFVEDFLNKIDKLTINDFLNKDSDLSIQKTRRFEKNRYYDLKIWSEKPKRRLYKGEATGINDYPFIVSVHVKDEFSCSGNIISKAFVLTSASCLQSVYKNRLVAHNLPSVVIRIGSDFISKYGEIVPIVTIFFHPKYNPTYLKNNIAILRMEKHTYFRTNRNIRRIDFDDKKRKVLESSHQITLLGWGSKLKDDGGPAIVNGILVGVVSFAPTICGARNSPTVFTKISCYNKWIRSIINEDISMQWNITVQEETLSQGNDTQNFLTKKNDNENSLKIIGPKNSEHYMLRGQIDSIKRLNKKSTSQISYEIQLKVNNKDKINNTMRYTKTYEDQKNGQKTNVELPDNYNFYSVEGDYTDEEGLSIEDIKENTQKQENTTTQDAEIHSERKTDVQKEKVIEEHFINILENILMISTKKQFRDYLRQVTLTLKSTLATRNIRNGDPIMDRKKQVKSTNAMSSSSTTAKPLNIYKKIIDFFTKN